MGLNFLKNVFELTCAICTRADMHHLPSVCIPHVLIGWPSCKYLRFYDFWPSPPPVSAELTIKPTQTVDTTGISHSDP